MSTLKQQQSSRANGAKSNGPTSPEGKAASSRNSIRFGLYAKSLIILGEDPAEFDALVERYHQTFYPVGADQEALVATLVRTEWLMVRLNKLESEIWQFQIRKSCIPEHEIPIGKAHNIGNVDFKLLQRRLDSADRTYRRTRELLLKLQKQQDSKPLPPSPGSFDHSAKQPPALASQPSDDADPLPPTPNPQPRLCAPDS